MFIWIRLSFCESSIYSFRDCRLIVSYCEIDRRTNHRLSTIDPICCHFPLSLVIKMQIFQWNPVGVLNVNLIHLYSATCIASETLLVNHLYSAPSRGHLWQCRLGFEHDTLRLLPLPLQPVRPTCTPGLNHVEKRCSINLKYIELTCSPIIHRSWFILLGAF